MTVAGKKFSSLPTASGLTDASSYLVGITAGGEDTKVSAPSAFSPYLSIDPPTGDVLVGPNASALGRLTIIGLFGSTESVFFSGLTASGAGSGDAQHIYNAFLINNDGYSASIETSGVNIAMNSVAGTGTKNALAATMTLQTAAATGGDLQGVLAIASSAVNNGGTNTGAGAAGTLLGVSAQGRAFSGATNYNVITGAELSTRVDTGATVKHRWGTSIVSYGQVQGASTDAAYHAGANGTAYWNIIIHVDNTNNGTAAVGANSSILAVTGAATVTAGIDFTNLTFTGNAFTSTGFAVDNVGIVTTRVCLVGDLPPAGTPGRKAFVTNATVTTFASIVAAGGGNGVPVYDDGTNWRIG